jgi:6-phosphogluconolactonase (cycloisomerase 2 family)
MPDRNFKSSPLIRFLLATFVTVLNVVLGGCGGLTQVQSATVASHFIYALARPDGVVVHRINLDGSLVAIPNSPFPAPSGPTSIAAGGQFIFVGSGGPFQASGISNGQTITTYRQDPSTGAITAVATLPRDNLHLPLFMVSDAGAQFLFVVNESGSLEVHSVAANGELTQVYETDAQFHAFAAPVSHPNGKFLYVWAQENLSQPAIFRFRLDSRTGVPVEILQIQTTALAGIRITPDGRFLLALSPQPDGYDLCSFSLNPVTGMTPTDNLDQAIPTSCVFAGAIPTGIAVHPSGKLLALTQWTTADGSTGTVAIHALDRGNIGPVSGTPQDVGAQALAPKFSPDGKLLFVSNHLSVSKINVFAVDATAGNIRAVPGSPFEMGNTGVPVIH